MAKLLAINGSYREDGAIDQLVALAVQAAAASGLSTEVVALRNYPIEFCLNCRECAQQPGEVPGKCVHNDGMHELVEKIEAADAFILAAPTNFYSITAIYKRFMERLVVYAYWPWGKHAPEFRKKKPAKKAILIASCAAPGIIGRFAYTTMKQLKMTAKTIGAKPVGSVFVGLMSQQKQPELSSGVQERVRRIVQKLT